MNQDEIAAILLEKINIFNDFFLFRPIVGIIGKLDPDEESFVTKNGVELSSMNDTDFLFSQAKECYGYEIEIPELLKKYKVRSKKEAMDEYMHEMSCMLHLGFYYEDNDFLDIVDMTYEQLNSLVVSRLTGTKMSTKDNIVELTKDDIDMILQEKTAKAIREKLIYYRDFLTANKRLEVFPSESLTSCSCDTDANKSLVETANPSDARSNIKINVSELYNNITSSIKAQNEQIEDIVSTIAKNYIGGSKHKKSHILLTGPTGSGKSEIIEQISKHINVPMASYDMTQISVTGYVGRNIDDALLKLYRSANNDIIKAQNGILALDEIDKKSSHNNDDVAGRGVLNSLLKILDGTVFDMEYDRGRTMPFDTSNLTVVAMGAFSDMKRKKNNIIGFNEGCEIKQPETGIEDYVKYGMPEEFMGRFTTLVSLNELKLDDLKSILLTSELSPLLSEIDFLSDFGIELVYGEDYIEAVARKAIALKTGARALKSIVNSTFRKAEFQILRDKNYEKLIINAETVNDNKAYVLK